MELIIGSHVSYKNDSQLLGSVKEAISYGENTFMFYTGAPQNTNRGAIKKELTSEAYDMMKNNDIDINNVVVGANAVVVDDVPDNAVVVGVPGKVVSLNASKITKYFN